MVFSLKKAKFKAIFYLKNLLKNLFGAQQMPEQIKTGLSMFDCHFKQINSKVIKDLLESDPN